MRTSSFPLYDRLIPGGLRPLLASLAAEGLSMEDITYKLRSEHEVTVSKATVRRWLDDCGIKTAAQTGATS